jgi:hypothetical protein
LSVSPGNVPLPAPAAEAPMLGLPARKHLVKALEVDLSRTKLLLSVLAAGV